MSKKEEIKRLQEEELKNVNGGSSCQTYSGDTYEQLGLKAEDLYYKQRWTNHPLIVTLVNSCKLGGGDSCGSCRRRFKPSWTLTSYCSARSEEYDECR